MSLTETFHPVRREIPVRGTHTRAAAAVAAALALTVAGPAHAAPQTSRSTLPSAVDLKTENKVDPIGIDDRAPLLSWRSAGSPQAAYEIGAGHSGDAPRHGKADVWRSGKVSSPSSVTIPFPRTLTAREAVAWQVRVWNDSGRVSRWSSPATFEMGLLNPSDWSARWIENSSYDYTRPDGTESPLPAFGKAFAVHGKVAKARLYMTGLGMYATTLNGRPVSSN